MALAALQHFSILAVIVGGSSVIGLAIANKLRQVGTDLILKLWSDSI